MTTLTAGRIIRAAYSIDRRHLDAIYVTGQNGKPDGLYWSTEKASQIRMCSKGILNTHARNGSISNVTWKGRRYLFERDLEPPEGYGFLEEVADITGYSPRNLQTMAGNGIVKSARFYNGRLLICKADALAYKEKRSAKPPEGRVHIKVAAAKYGVTERHVRELKSSGKVGSIKLPEGECLLSEADLDGLLSSEGFVSYSDASIQFSISKSWLSRLASMHGFGKKKVGKHVLLRRSDIQRYVNGECDGATESNRLEEPAVAAAVHVSHSVVLRNNRGQPTKFADALFDRHAVNADDSEALSSAMLEDLRKMGNGHGSAEEDVRAIIKMFAKVG